jgi:hypothetical protein
MVKASTFGSESLAMRVAVQMIEALWCKLRMFGIPLDGPADVYCDNQGIMNNTSQSKSQLMKKHNAVCYYCIREANAAGPFISH